MAKPPKPPGTPPGVATPSDREARLAAALRANLRRRKAQARGRNAQPPKPPRSSTKD